MSSRPPTSGAVRRLTTAGAALAALCCGGPGDSPIGEWSGSITTAGNLTTVVNESGSVWGGTAGLIEDLSIGVAAGDERYMFGHIEGIGFADGKIYVLEDRPPSVRVYDEAGNHLSDFGREGQDPGEFDNPVTMGIDPAGRVIVQDLSRVSVFDLDGNPIATWPYRGGLILPITVTVDGVVYVPRNWREGGELRAGLVGIDPQGNEIDRVAGPDHDFEPWQLVAESGGRTMIATVAYAPAAVWAVLPSGAVARGIRDEYSVEVSRPDGTTLRIERDVDLLPVTPAERAYRTETTAARMREFELGWAWTARPIPESKPAYHAFFGDRYGRLWVHRIVRTDPVTGCRADPEDEESPPWRSCWRDVMGFDVFDENSGRYLGRVTLPLSIPRRPPPVFLEDAMLLAVEDAEGTPMVKRYRLALPGGS